MMRYPLCLLVFASVLSAAPAAAQRAVPRSSPGDSVQVLLTLLPDLAHPTARASIVRPVGPGAPDIIFVTTQTTAADLHRAIDMLLDARHTFGPSVAREMQAHVPAAEVTPMDLGRETSYLTELPNATELDIPGLGLHRSLFMTLEDRP